MNFGLLALFVATAVPLFANLPALTARDLTDVPLQRMFARAEFLDWQAQQARHAANDEARFVERLKLLLDADRLGKQALAERPVYLRAWYQRARAAFRSGRKSDMLEFYRAMEADDPWSRTFVNGRIELAANLWPELTRAEKERVHGQIRASIMIDQLAFIELVGRSPESRQHIADAVLGHPEATRHARWIFGSNKLRLEDYMGAG